MGTFGLSKIRVAYAHNRASRLGNEIMGACFPGFSCHTWIETDGSKTCLLWCALMLLITDNTKRIGVVLTSSCLHTWPASLCWPSAKCEYY